MYSSVRKLSYLIDCSPFLAPLYESTGRAMAVELGLALHKMLKFLVKVFKSLYLLNP